MVTVENGIRQVPHPQHEYRLSTLGYSHTQQLSFVDENQPGVTARNVS
jgi:hypothetical protein